MLSVYKQFKTYLLGIIIGLSICCIGLFLYLIPPGRWNSFAPREITKKIPKPYVVYSGSMEPAIKTAGVIFTLPQDAYFPGDIITFALNDDSENLVTHRVEYKEFPNGFNEEPTYLTSGDANEDLDNWEVTNEQIIGKVFFSVPYLGYVVDFAQKPQGFILLVIIPATIIIYEELKFLKSKISEKFNRPLKGNPCKVPFHKFKKPISDVPKVSVLIPTAGALVVLIATSAGFFFDREVSIGNILSAAESFDEFPTPTPIPEPIEVGPGDVVINEIMWMGSTRVGINDEWLELRNMTANPIDISGWKIEGALSGLGSFEITSGLIPANGLFLISNFDETTSAINIAPDLVDVSLQLDNDDAQYILRDDLGNIMDTADDGSEVPLAGINGTGGIPDKSMERNINPGDGTLLTNWHDASMAINFDADVTDFGTPSSVNSP
ncbi:signal peptidase I [Patescibacteria group bacterium]|nr:signal peptidase I [Patescibacteria group bacterium]